ncbi:MAG: hypothetical protein H7062_21190 [Candidatus Saccharimonas sp.]|nr:hypothetical protein [Planctomycetaceae bacterium]
MSFTPEFVDGGRGLVFTAAGELTAADVLAPKTIMLAEPDRLRPLRHALVLLEGVTRFAPTNDEIRDIATADTKIALFAPDVSVAIVAPTDFLFGLSRMWEVFAEGTAWRISVFRSRAEADAWIRTETASRIG